MFISNANNSIDFMIRDACMSDLEDICRLGFKLNTVNLPASEENLIKVIESSTASFDYSQRDSTKRTFLFVLVTAENKVIGTGQIFAKHGTLDSPHTFFSVLQDERYSCTLNKYFRHQVLRLGQSFDGPTEVGSLIIDQAYRSHPNKLGKMLSYIRFLFMAMQPDLFSHKVIAELLPPLGDNFESALWEAIGRKFTGLDYYEADQISRQNKEFITSLFPSSDIYVSLLPESAQDVIGQIGANSKGAANLLSSIGFRYSYKIDPFDGGPHFEAEQENIALIKNSVLGYVRSSLDINHKTNDAGLIARFDYKKSCGDRFRGVCSEYFYNAQSKEIFLSNSIIKSLNIDIGQEVFATSLIKI